MELRFRDRLLIYEALRSRASEIRQYIKTVKPLPDAERMLQEKAESADSLAIQIRDIEESGTMVLSPKEVRHV
jgi:hypothetical protein